MQRCKLLFGLLVLVASIPALSQSDHRRPSAGAGQSPDPSASKQNLSDDFAKAGLKALRAIERTLDKPSFEGGSIAVPRQTQELIDNADAEARTDEEKAVVAALNNFYIGRLMNNLERELLKPPSYNEESELKSQAEVEKNPRNIEMNSREAACSRLLDEMLRARQFINRPLGCDTVNAPKNDSGNSANLVKNDSVPIKNDNISPVLPVSSSNAEGQGLMEKVVNELGGTTALGNVRGWKATAKGRTIIVEYPDKLWINVVLPTGPATSVYTAYVSFITMNGQTQQVPAEAREEAMRIIKLGILSIAQHVHDPKYLFAARDFVIVNGVNARVLDINADGDQVRWLVEPSTGRILRTVRKGIRPDGSATDSIADYSDWRTVSGISIPFKGGIGEGETQYFEINPPLDPRIFELPRKRK